MKLKFISILALILIIGVANAVSTDKDIADMYYQRAVDEYNRTNCKNASQFAELALNYYGRVHDREGENKTVELIIQINSCLRSQGYGYYYKAFEFLNQGEYENATIFVNKAKDRYSMIPYPEGIDRCDELLARINERYNEARKEYADELYYRAEDFFVSEDYLNAKTYAEDALAIYTEANDSEGASRCAKFLKTVDDKITEIEEMANIDYGRAQELYSKGGYENYEKAIGYAEEAKNLYLKIGYQESAAKAQSLIDILFEEMILYEEEQKKEAEESYKEARTYYLIGEYDNAISELNRSITIYVRFKSLAKKTNNRKKEDYYLDKIKECNALLVKINVGKEKAKVIEKAENYYDISYDFFSSACFRNASENVENAYGLFESIDYSAGMSKCIVLREKINENLEGIDEANSYYSSADGHYRTADYGNATEYLKNATIMLRSIECNNEEKCCYTDYRLCQDLNSSIQRGIAKKKEANGYYLEAGRYFELNNYESSLDYARRANDIYTNINYSAGISKSRDLISENEKRVSEAARLQDIFRIGITLVVVLMIVIIILRWRSEREKRNEEEKRRLVEGKRIVEEERLRKLEEDIRRKEEEKHRLEDERKKLHEIVEKEKKVIGEEKIEEKVEIPEEEKRLAKEKELGDKMLKAMKGEKEIAKTTLEEEMVSAGSGSEEEMVIADGKAKALEEKIVKKMVVGAKPEVAPKEEKVSTERVSEKESIAPAEEKPSTKIVSGGKVISKEKVAGEEGND